MTDALAGIAVLLVLFAGLALVIYGWAYLVGLGLVAAGL